MPQLDVRSYFSATTSLVLLFLLLVIVFQFWIVPLIAQTLKTRALLIKEQDVKGNEETHSEIPLEDTFIPNIVKELEIKKSNYEVYAALFIVVLTFVLINPESIIISAFLLILSVCIILFSVPLHALFIGYIESIYQALSSWFDHEVVINTTKEEVYAKDLNAIATIAVVDPDFNQMLDIKNTSITAVGQMIDAQLNISELTVKKSMWLGRFWKKGMEVNGVHIRTVYGEKWGGYSSHKSPIDTIRQHPQRVEETPDGYKILGSMSHIPKHSDQAKIEESKICDMDANDVQNAQHYHPLKTPKIIPTSDFQEIPRFTGYVRDHDDRFTEIGSKTTDGTD